MRCPFCGSEKLKVIDSRSEDEANSIKRRRMCECCQKKFNTYEKIDTIPIMVIKKDDTRESFDKTKIEKGILSACYKRPVSADAIKKIVDKIETDIINMGKSEIKGSEIGLVVMQYLRDLDSVAYVRFASVYREFKDAASFISIIPEISGDIK